MPASSQNTDTKTFAWQGIELVVPAEWELAAYRGDFKSGYFSLDDGVAMRLRARWEHGGGRMDAVIRKYRRSINKAAKAKVFEELDPGFASKSFREGKTLTVFRWQAEESAYGLGWRCDGCGRTVFVEVLFPPGADDKRLARQILISARDHRDDGKQLWSVYGFAFTVPAHYNLERSELVSGRLHFGFIASKRSWLTVERWSAASQWLKRIPLKAWPEEYLKHGRVSVAGDIERTEDPALGHAGLRFTGKAVRRSGLAALLVRPQPIDGRVWHNADEDRIYAVVASGKAAGEVDSVAASVKSAPA